MNRRKGLDFLRGVAILAVMGAHFPWVHTDNLVLDAICKAFKSFGGMGVNLFFSLSGYLVGGMLLQEYRDTGGLQAGRFLGRRAFKIWPPLYALLLFHLIVGRHPADTYFLQNLFHVQNYFGTSIQQTWSLAVEEHFYILICLLLASMVGRSPRFIISNLILLAGASYAIRYITVDFGYLDAAFRQTQCRMDSLLYGVILAAVAVFYPQRFNALGRYPIFVGAVSFLSLAVACTVVEDGVLDRKLGYICQGVAFCGWLIIFDSPNAKLARPLWPISKIGLYSYGIYLWHSLALEPGRIIIAKTAAMQPEVAYFVVILVETLIALSLGVVTTKAIEWPSLRLREQVLPIEEKGLQPALVR
jgi:peptidoglycan/LPS O-acetylase OafA/YrhL